MIRLPSLSFSYSYSQIASSILKLLTGIALLIELGCASRSPLADYPRTQIDRPYILPPGVSSLGVPLISQYSRDRWGNSEFLPPIFVPLFWNQPVSTVSKKLEVSWIPVPYTYSHQFYYDPTGYFGLNVGAGLGYSSATRLYFGPSVSIDYRKKITKNFALDPQFGYAIIIPTSGTHVGMTNHLGVQGVFQVHEFFAFSSGGAFHFSNGLYSAWESISQSLQEQVVWSAWGSVEIGAFWSAGRKWDINPKYSYSGIGRSDGAYSHTAVIEFVYFW
jgi:hypothetical protein